MVQKYLAKFGWYRGKKDGWFGNQTDRAIREFQKTMGLKVDGIAGPITKDFMCRPRHDSHRDQFWQEGGEEKIGDFGQATTLLNYPRGSTVLYHIGSSPAYLNHQNVEHDIEAAFDSW